MERALEFLRKYRDVAFATVEDNKPKLRTFQIMKQEGTNLYFATSPEKEVYHQLKTNPNIEILSMQDNKYVRAMGSAVFDVPDHTAKEIYDSNPVLPRLYKEYTDLVYFRLPISKLDYYDLTTNPPTLKSYNF